jgi:hypothetical protein
MDRGDLTANDDALLGLLDVGRPARPFGDVDRAPADQGSPACAGAQFCQCHPYGHNVTFPLLAPLPPDVGGSRASLLCDQVQNKRLSASSLTMNRCPITGFLTTPSRRLPLTCQSGTLVEAMVDGSR